MANAHILGGQIKEVKDETKDGFRKVEENFKELKARQTMLEHHDMAIAERIFKDCAQKK